MALCPPPNPRRASTASLNPFSFTKRRSSGVSVASTPTSSAPQSSIPAAGFHPFFPLPTPIRPETLSMPAPSLGDAPLPRPRSRSGAPPVDTSAVRVAPPITEQLKQSIPTPAVAATAAIPSPRDPATPPGLNPSVSLRLAARVKGLITRRSSSSSTDSSSTPASGRSSMEQFAANANKRASGSPHPGVCAEWFWKEEGEDK